MKLKKKKHKLKEWRDRNKQTHVNLLNSQPVKS